MGPIPIVLFLLVGGGDTPSPAPNHSNDALPPITGSGRVAWAVKSTIGPASLFVGVVDAAWGLEFDRPKEYGEGMEGYGKRYGLRLSSIGTSNVMEAGLGAIWNEDPRYHRAREESKGGRFNHALKMTVMAERSDGSLAPAYARYIAYVGSNAISDAWRPDSQQNASNTALRVGYRFAGRLMGNLWIEFWPSMKQHMFWNKH
jgi:hypothetical protein